MTSFAMLKRLLPHRAVIASIAVVGLFSLACADSGSDGDPTGPRSATGRLVVWTNTTGDEIDVDGYQVTIDGANSRAIDATGNVSVDALPTGSRVVELNGLAPNCEVNGSSQRSVMVSENETTTVGFEIECRLSFQSVSAGFRHSCGVTTMGRVLCWGNNSVGELGDGTNTDSNVPVPISGGLTFQLVSAGVFHTCGVTTAGVAYCWGLGERGRLGDGTNTESNVPVPVSGGLIFQSVNAGSLHTCGVTTAGGAYCWGDNGAGALGDGTTKSSNVPVEVSGGLTFRMVDAYSCGVTTGGTCTAGVGTNSAGSGMARTRPGTCPLRSRAGSPSSR